MSGPGRVAGAGRTLRRPPPPLRPGGLASPCARLRLSLRRREETLPRAVPRSLWAGFTCCPPVLRRLMAAGSRPGAAGGDAGNGFGVEEEAQAGGPGCFVWGQGLLKGSAPRGSPGGVSPLCFTVVHPSDVSGNSLWVYRGVPSLLLIKKPGAIEALGGWKHPT